MRIIYSAGNRPGANEQLVKFLENIDTRHEVKIAAYIKSSTSVNIIDWTLDALHYSPIYNKKIAKLWSLFKHKNIPLLNLKNAELFITEATKFEPDLIICDCEPIAGHLAKTLGCSLWYCSPLHLLDGINWGHDLRYRSKLDPLKNQILRFPEPDRIFIYSPFGDIKFRPILKSGYEWVTPFYNKIVINPEINEYIAIINESERYQILSKMLNSLDYNMTLFGHEIEKLSHAKTYKLNEKDNYKKYSGSNIKWTFLNGETNYLSDAFYNEKNLIIAPNLKDPETLINATVAKIYNIGADLSQIELMEQYAIYELEKSLNRKYTDNYLSVQNYMTLTEQIEEL